MSFDRFATAMIALGAGLGLAATSLVPTSASVPERQQPAATSADYPEITAVTYESYPVAAAPLLHHGQMRMAEWERPLSDQRIYGQSGSYADEAQYDDIAIAPDPQIDEDFERGDTVPANAIPVDEPPVDSTPVTVADHP